MNRARIVVLTIAIGAGGVAAYLASGSRVMAAVLPPEMRALSTGISPEAGAGRFMLSNDRVDTIRPSSRAIAEINQVEVVADDHSRQHSSINVDRHGVANPATIRK
jgi:Flp pilus assembly protein CpaB